MAYSMDLRLKVLEALDQGQAVSVVAQRFGIGIDAVRAYKRRRDQYGTPIRLKTGPKSPTKLTPEDDAKMLELIAKDPGITLREIAEHLGGKVVESTLSRRLRRLEISLKKVPDRSRTAAARCR